MLIPAASLVGILIAQMLPTRESAQTPVETAKGSPAAFSAPSWVASAPPVDVAQDGGDGALATATPASTVSSPGGGQTIEAEIRPTRAPQPASTAVVQRLQTPQAANPVNSDLWAALAASNWPPSLWSRVHAIVMCESRGQVTARNGAHYGLLQQNVNLHGYPGDTMVAQLNSGYAVYLKQGWSAWSCA